MEEIYKLQFVKSTEFYQSILSGRIDTRAIETLISPSFRIMNMVIQEARARENGFESWEFKIPRDFDLSYLMLYIEKSSGKIEVIGFLRLWQYKKRGYINMVRIHAKYRGKGLCQRLINFVISEMKKGTSLHLHVELDNISAVKCYEKCGFKYGKFYKNDNSVAMYYK